MANNHVAIRIDAVNLKKADFAISRPIVVVVCMTWLLRIIGCPSSTPHRWHSRAEEEPSTASIADFEHPKPLALVPKERSLMY
jgi:hypothetical protein